MPKISDVIPGNPIEAVWGNQSIRDRTVQRMTSEADRDASVPSPGDGETVWVQDINELQIWDGTQWRVSGTGEFLALAGGTMSGPIDMGFNFVYNLPNPVNPGDAVHKAYADGFLPLAGGTLTGLLTTSAGTLGSNATNSIMPMRASLPDGSGTQMEFLGYRHAAGSDHNSSMSSIHRKVDATWFGGLGFRSDSTRLWYQTTAGGPYQAAKQFVVTANNAGMWGDGQTGIEWRNAIGDSSFRWDMYRDDADGSLNLVTNSGGDAWKVHTGGIGMQILAQDPSSYVARNIVMQSLSPTTPDGTNGDVWIRIPPNPEMWVKFAGAWERIV